MTNTTTYYIQEAGRVLGGTITLPNGAQVPSNAFLPNEEQTTNIRRWLANNLRVYWTSQIGPHLDPSRDPPAPVVSPPAPLPPPEPSTPPPPLTHPTELAGIALLEKLVEISNPNLTKAERVLIYTAAQTKLTALKTSLEN